MNNKKNGIPKLRFPGFTGAWEQRKLGEVLSYEQPGPYIVNSDNYDNKFNVPVLTAGKSFILGFTNEVKGIKKASESDPVIIFDDFTTGSHYVDFPFKVKSSALKILSKTNEKIDTKFIYEVLSRINYVPQSHERHWISQFSKFNVMIPTSQEQEKVGNFLKQLDHLIALHQRKLEHLQEQKKGLLQKMFPKKGETVPEVRFPGFTDAWEQRKLGEVADVIDPHPSHRAPAEVKIGIPFIGISDVNEIGEINYSTVRVVDEDIYEEHHRRYDLSIPSLGIGRVASLGKVIRLRNDIGKYAISPTMSVLQPDTRIEINYLYSYMNSSQFQKQFSAKSNGSTRQSVGIKDLRTLVVSVPSSSNEQQKIGEYFSKFDSLIALHQRKLDHLELMKKGLLQQMFV